MATPTAHKLANAFATYQTMAGLEPLLVGLGKYSRASVILDAAEALLSIGAVATAQRLLTLSGVREVVR